MRPRSSTSAAVRVSPSSPRSPIAGLLLTRGPCGSSASRLLTPYMYPSSIYDRVRHHRLRRRRAHMDVVQTANSTGTTNRFMLGCEPSDHARLHDRRNSPVGGDVLLHPTSGLVGGARRPLRCPAGDVALDELLDSQARAWRGPLVPDFDDDLRQLGICLLFAPLVVPHMHGAVEASPSAGDRIRPGIHVRRQAPALNRFVPFMRPMAGATRSCGGSGGGND